MDRRICCDDGCEYFSDEYDLESSFVIGDRLTDIELAKNLGAKGIFINDDTNLGTDEISVKRDELDDVIALAWEDISEYEEYPESRLRFKFGQPIKSVEDSLYEKDFVLEYKVKNNEHKKNTFTIIGKLNGWPCR